jgi:hypothetical protein
VIVATTGAVVISEALNEVISPEPDAVSPMPGAEFVQVKVVVPTVLTVAKITSAVGKPLQTTWSPGSLTCPVGLTVIVKLSVGPSQVTLPFAK